jgi:hypothetical protein
MAKGEPGRASFFVEKRRYYCVDLLSRDGRVIAPRYAHPETPEDALVQAKKRYASEQG